MAKPFKWKQKMFCVTSHWGCHRCYAVKDDADKDAKRNSSKKHGVSLRVVECDTVVTPLLTDKEV